MPDQLQLRGGTTTEHNTFTGASKEVTVDTTKKTAVVHDGATAGGNPLMREDGANSSLALGSAASPSLKFTGDTNTGIYSPGADQVAISTGGSGRLFVNNSGNVGIGTTAPVYKFDCRGEGAFELFNTSGGGNVLNFRPSLEDGNKFNMSISSYDHSGGGVGNADGLSINSFDGLSVCTGSSTTRNEKLRITEAGKVGVGTTSVAGTNTQLEVAGGTATEIKISSASANNANFRGLRFGITGDSNDYSGVLFKPNTAELRLEAGYSGFGGFQTFYTNGSERLRIDSSGHVGIGTSSPTERLQVTDGTNSNFYIAPGYNSEAGTRIGVGGGEFLAFAAAPFTTERMRIDSSGRLLVGTSSSLLSYAQLQVTGGSDNAGHICLASTYAAPTSGQNIGSQRYTNSAGGIGAVVGVEADANWTAGTSYPSRLVFSTTANSSSSPTERMRITSDGFIYFNTTVSPSTSGYGSGFLQVGASGSRRTALYQRAESASASSIQAFYNPNGLVGSISTSGSSTAYNTSSDYRLKENVVDIADGITRVKQLQPRRFNFIADADTTVDGFLAHEAQTVVPEAVTGTHNEVDDDGNPVYQGIDQSKLVPLLTAALQEAIAKIETLETKVAALEAG